MDSRLLTFGLTLNDNKKKYYSQQQYNMYTVQYICFLINNFSRYKQVQVKRYLPLHSFPFDQVLMLYFALSYRTSSCSIDLQYIIRRYTLKSSTYNCVLILNASITNALQVLICFSQDLFIQMLSSKNKYSDQINMLFKECLVI